MPDYTDSLPDSKTLRDTFSFAIELWQDRNQFIRSVITMLDGKNVISAPASTQYSIKTMRMYFLTAVANEKVARFLNQPTIQVIPASSRDEDRALSSKVEKGIEAAFYEMERNGDGDVWSKITFDAIVFDQGIERIERAPSAFWPEATLLDDDGKPLMSFEDKEALDAYKRLKGLPIRTVYVQPESFFPIYEGPRAVETFEVEFRSARSVLRNPLFRGAEDLRLQNNNVNTLIPIIHYNNASMCAYYAILGGQEWTPGQAPQVDYVQGGDLTLLHSYKHGLGQVPYNIVGGRYGGWKSQHNRIEGINNAILDLNQHADEVASQMLTYVRNTKWPTNVFKVDPEQRGTGSNPPKPPTVPEGESITMFKGEELAPLFQSVEDPQVLWLMDQIKEQIARLGGSPALFGQSQPGVDTGYHQNLQITQAEHLDEKIEEHLSQGGVGRATLLMLHIRAMNESVWPYKVFNEQDGRKRGEYIELTPDMLTPLPRISASVRKPRPVDFAASIRSAREASDDRGGKGPLLSDDTIRSDILGRTAPDEEEYKILVQSEKTKLILGGVLTTLISQRLNLMAAAASAPGLPNEGEVDPAAQAAVAQVSAPLQTGMSAGQAQPEANSGENIAISTGNPGAGGY